MRVVNSSNVSDDATFAFQVLDPASMPAIGRVSTRILNSRLELVDTVTVGELFYVYFVAENIRGLNQPFASEQQRMLANDGQFAITGSGLRASKTCKGFLRCTLGRFVLCGEVNGPEAIST